MKHYLLINLHTYIGKYAYNNANEIIKTLREEINSKEPEI